MIFRFELDMNWKIFCNLGVCQNLLIYVFGVFRDCAVAPCCLHLLTLWIIFDMICFMSVALGSGLCSPDCSTLHVIIVCILVCVALQLIHFTCGLHIWLETSVSICIIWYVSVSMSSCIHAVALWSGHCFPGCWSLHLHFMYC